MNTVHLNREEFHKTRKPRLQLDVLGCLVLHGELTKIKVEKILRKRHGDILDSFNKLEKKNFIRKGRREYGRGRKQYYYEITEKGLEVLCTIEPGPTKFWKSIFGYAHHFNNRDKITFEKVDEIFLQFGKVYFRYNHYNLPIYFDSFQSMRDGWFDYQNNRSGNKKISIEQKIIETLAVHPRITLEGVSKEIGESESHVGNILYNYTSDSFNPPPSKETSLIFGNMMDYHIKDKKFNDKFHTSFLLHNLIRVNQTDQMNRYELSLFGIALVLNLIRYNDMKKLSNGLFYGNVLPFTKYFDIVIANYKNSLPLIFGKWKFLKKVLKSFAAYNFDITIDENADHSRRESVRRGGNREIIDGIDDIAKYRYQQLYDLAKAGQTVLFGYLTGIPHENMNEYSKNYCGDYLIRNKIKVDSPDLNKLTHVYTLLMGLLLMLSPIEYLMSKGQSPELQQIATKTELLNMIEESFADEVSAMYYFNLFDEQEFGTVASIHMKLYPDLKSPKQCLYAILRSDVDGSLKGWFNKWMIDIANLQKENYETLNPSK